LLEWSPTFEIGFVPKEEEEEKEEKETCHIFIIS